MFMFRILQREPEGNTQRNGDRELIKKWVEQEGLSVDLKISLYISACHTQPYDDLQPKPPLETSTGADQSDLSDAISILNYIPSLQCLHAFLKHSQNTILSEEVYNVVKWIVLGLKEPKLSLVGEDQFSSILSLVESPQPAVTAPKIPELIFSVKPQLMSVMAQDWIRKTSSEGTMFAFLPCEVGKLHTMIHKGLVSDQQENLQLNTDLNSCVNEDLATWTWGKSNIGRKLVIVAMVEFVDNPQYVEEETSDTRHPQLGNLTVKHYRINDARFARIRYLLVYPFEKQYTPLMNSIELGRKRVRLETAIAASWCLAIGLCFLYANLRRNPGPN